MSDPATGINFRASARKDFVPGYESLGWWEVGGLGWKVGAN